MCAVSVSVDNCMQVYVHTCYIIMNIVMYVHRHNCTYVARRLRNNYMFACRII